MIQCEIGGGGVKCEGVGEEGGDRQRDGWMAGSTSSVTHFILPASQRGNLHQSIVRDDEQRDLFYSAGIPTQEPVWPSGKALRW